MSRSLGSVAPVVLSPAVLTTPSVISHEEPSHNVGLIAFLCHPYPSSAAPLCRFILKQGRVPTVDVLGGLVGVVLQDHLDEVHALDDEALERHALAGRREHVADGELQGALDQGDEGARVALQEV